MKIVYCLPEISHPGGIGRVTSIKANYWASIGHKVYIVTTDQKGAKPFYELSSSVELIDLQLNFNEGKHKPIFSRLKYKSRQIKVYKQKLYELLISIQPDITVSTFTNEAGFLYKLKDGSKKVLECHFSHDVYLCMNRAFHLSFHEKIFNYYKTNLSDRIASKYDAFVVLTREDADSWSVDNLCFIPNMLSFEPIGQSTLQNKQVIAVGRLDAQKKFERLLDIWAEVSTKVKDWKLQIYGQGPDYDKLVYRIAQLGIGNSVIINKPVNNIIDKYLDSSILVMTSTYEGLPLVLLEAIACGVPPVCYAFKCGPKDIIRNGIDGYYIKEGSQSEFVQKMVLLMTDTERRIEMGQEAKKRSTDFSVELIMQRWINLFQQLTEK